MISDDAVLELIFNPEHQGLSLESVAQTIDTRPSIEPELLKKLQDLEGRAVKEAEQGHLDAALKLLDECIGLEPSYASAYNNRAQVHRLMKNNELARKDLDTVIDNKLGQGQPSILKQAYTQRAILRRQQGDQAGAHADFQLGAKYGNPIARNYVVNENPYAKMCNQIMLEVMSRESRQ